MIQEERRRHGMGSSRRALTPEQRRVLIAASQFVLERYRAHGEWPWIDMRQETLQRAIEKLED